MDNNEEIIHLMQSLLKRPIAFHRIFADMAGGAAPGLFLSQAWYWSQHTTDKDGWFYKTQEEWEKETALTRSEQEHARKRLMSIGILEEKRTGIPAKLFYRLNMATISAALTGETKAVSAQDIIDIYATRLRTLSKAAHMRSLKLGAHSECVDYAAILKTHGMICGICKGDILLGIGQTEGSLVFDHIIPLDAGGANTEENIQPAHALCNTRKGGNPEYAPTDKFAYGKQTRMLTVSKQERLPKADKSASCKQTFLTETTTETTTEKKEEIPLISPMGKLCKNDCDGIEGIDSQPITATLEATPRDRLHPQDRLVVEEESPENDPLPFPTRNTIPTAKQDPSPPPSRRRRPGSSPELLADADEVLAHLCEVTGKKFRVHGEIATILRKGYTKAQCLLVIDWLHIVRRNRSKMDREWVEQRLGITTPFYEKNFAGYLADAELWEQHKDSPSTHDHTATRTRFMDFYTNGTR